MRIEEFYKRSDELKVAILSSISDHIKNMGYEFDQEKFVAETSTDLVQLSREAFFYGAEVFVED